jgi:ADP-heptose:LPS heptosyltransferase
MKVRLLKLIDRAVGGIVTACLPPARIRSLPPLRRLLIIRPGGIGDAALLIPAILAIKETYPNADITLLAEKRNHALFDLVPAVSRVFLYDRPLELFAAVCGSYDVVIDTEQWHRLSAIVTRLTRAPVMIGYATNDRLKLFTHAVPYSQCEYEADSFFRLLLPLGIQRREAEIAPYLVVPDAARRKAEELLLPLVGGRFVTLFPGASIPERRWNAEKFGSGAGALHAKGVPVVVVGGAQDAASGDMIIAGTPGINLAGKTALPETAAVIARGAILVGGDSGILHIGVGLGTPTVSLFGPGIAVKWAPQGGRHIVINKQLSCSPCTIFGNTPKCPFNARCMAEISPQEVTAAVERLLAGNLICS